MLKKLITLFKIGRKLSTSGAIQSIYEIYEPPIGIKVLFFIIGFNFGYKKSKGCSLTIKIGETIYPVEGTKMHSHGDPHS